MDRHDDSNEYDGPELSEAMKVSMLVGPEGGTSVLPGGLGAIYITPKTAYFHNGQEWIDLEAGTEPIYRTLATYFDPQEIRQRGQHER